MISSLRLAELTNEFFYVLYIYIEYTQLNELSPRIRVSLSEEYDIRMRMLSNICSLLA